MSKSVTNIAASIRQRLLNLARESKEDFGLLLTKYSLQRVLYRIAESKYRDQFVLKGALLFELWTDQRYRPTRDAGVCPGDGPHVHLLLFVDLGSQRIRSGP